MSQLRNAMLLVSHSVTIIINYVSGQSHALLCYRTMPVIESMKITVELSQVSSQGNHYEIGLLSRTVIITKYPWWVTWQAL